MKDVVFNETPMHVFVTDSGEKTTIKDYFAKTYGKKITNLDGPMFQVKMSDKIILLPPELCLTDGIKEN